LFACKYFSLILKLLRSFEREESATPLPASKGLDLFVMPALPVYSPEDFFFTVP
jgi:hypothetical protein